MADMSRSGLLEWTQPRVFDRLFELREGETPVGTLAWEGVLSRLATADTCLGSWEIEEIGLLSRTVEVREAGIGRLVATFSPRLMGDGTLEFRRWQVLALGIAEFLGHGLVFHGRCWNAAGAAGRRRG